MGEFKEYQDIQTGRNFKPKYIIALIFYRKNEWMFAGVYESSNCKEIGAKRFRYDTKLLPVHSEYIGRLIIGFEKIFRKSYPFLDTVADQLEVIEVLRDPIGVMEFPGYNHVNVPFTLLKHIILKGDLSWKTALSNVNGIYLITDHNEGKLYVGGAFGEARKI